MKGRLCNKGKHCSILWFWKKKTFQTCEWAIFCEIYAALSEMNVGLTFYLLNTCNIYLIYKTSSAYVHAYQFSIKWISIFVCYWLWGERAFTDIVTCIVYSQYCCRVNTSDLPKRSELLIWVLFLFRLVVLWVLLVYVCFKLIENIIKFWWRYTEIIYT